MTTETDELIAAPSYTAGGVVGGDRRPILTDRGRSRTRVAGARVLRVVLPAIVIGLLLFIWQYGPMWLGLHSYEVPTLSEDLNALGSHWSVIGPQLEVSIADALVGFLIGNLLAIFGAVSFSQSRYVEWSFLPVAILIQTIPIVVFAPLSFTIFNALHWGATDPLPIIGVGTKPILLVTVLITFFPTLINMTIGLKAIDPNLYEFMQLVSSSKLRMRVDAIRAGRRHGPLVAAWCMVLTAAAEAVERWRLLWRLRLPSSLPFLFSSFRITSTLCFVGAFVGEWTLAVNTGIGGLIKEYIFLIDYPGMWASVIVFSLSSMIFFGVIVVAERIFVPWQRAS